MSTKAKYTKVRISNEDAAKVRSLAGYKVVGDYVEVGGDLTVLLERPEQPARVKAVKRWPATKVPQRGQDAPEVQS